MVGVGKAVGIRILSPPEVAQDHTWCDPGTEPGAVPSHTLSIPVLLGSALCPSFQWISPAEQHCGWLQSKGGSWGWPRKRPTGALGQRETLTGLEVGQLLPHQAGLTL